jgi:uncharacterized protein
MDREDIAALVRELRERLHLTQEQFAQRLGVTYSTVNHWENGKRRPQPFLAERLWRLRRELDAPAGSSAEGAAATHAFRPGGSPGNEEGEWSAAPGGLREEIWEMVNRIVEHFRPEKVILFGSNARGEARADSDVDLLIVMDVRGSKREAQLEVRRALHDIRVPKDVIVTTPEEFEGRRRVVGTIERAAWREGEVLYGGG